MLPVGYLTAVPFQICIVDAANVSADNSARHGQNWDKEKILTTWLNIVGSIFLTDNNSI